MREKKLYKKSTGQKQIKNKTKKAQNDRNKILIISVITIVTTKKRK